MLLSKHDLFSDGQAVTGSVASTKVIKRGIHKGANKDGKPGYYKLEEGPINLFAHVGEKFVGGTSVEVIIETSDDGFLTKEVVGRTGAVPVAKLKEGYGFRLGSLPAGIKSELRAFYVVVGTMTAGKITSGFCLEEQTNGMR
jgi:hypothetical protein